MTQALRHVLSRFQCVVLFALVLGPVSLLGSGQERIGKAQTSGTGLQSTIPSRTATVPTDTSWKQKFGNGNGLNDPPYALATNGTVIYVGGSFNTAGPLLNVNNIAMWDGSQWQYMGSGTDGWVRAIAVSSAGVFAGGNFKLADGKEVNGIARWDGSTWQPLGIGVDGEVYAIAINGTDVFVGGRFSNAGGQPAPNVAKWTGAHWEALGSGVDGTVTSIAVLGSTVCVSGTFTHAGINSAKYLAQWNGTLWQSFGSGPDSYVYALASDGQNLYAGGQFSSINGQITPLLAKWDGSTWSSMGQGVIGNSVFVITTSGQELYIGGDFTSVNQIPAQNTARWDGVRWQAMGSGVNGIVRAIVVNKYDVFVGGSFTQAGGSPASYLALWHNSPPVVRSFQISPVPPVSIVAATDSISWTVVARDAQDSVLINYENPSLALWINNSLASADQWKVGYTDKNGQYIRSNTLGNDIFRYGVAHFTTLTTLAEDVPVTISIQDTNGVVGTTPPYRVVPGPVTSLDIFPYDPSGATVKHALWSGSDGQSDTVFIDTEFPYYIRRFDRYHNIDTISAPNQVNVTTLGSGSIDVGGPTILVQSMVPHAARVMTDNTNQFQLIALWNGQYFSSDLIIVRPADGIGNTTGIPSSISLEQNYPNPFNPATMIRFQLNEAKTVSLTVYDILGREIVSLLEKKLPAGVYDVPFNGVNLTSGVYYYKLSMDGFSAVRKMILLK